MTDGAAEAKTPPQHAAPRHLMTRCWTCERASDPAATLWATLESHGPARDALGYEVTAKASERIVTVPVPRCRPCRSWFAWQQGIIAVSIFLGIFTPGVTLVVYAHLSGVALPPDMFDGSAHVVSLLVFFACIGLSVALWWYACLAILSLALRHRPMRSRSEKNFPPIVALRTGGWTWPRSSAD